MTNTPKIEEFIKQEGNYLGSNMTAALSSISDQQFDDMNETITGILEDDGYGADESFVDYDHSATRETLADWEVSAVSWRELGSREINSNYNLYRRVQARKGEQRTNTIVVYDLGKWRIVVFI